MKSIQMVDTKRFRRVPFEGDRGDEHNGACRLRLHTSGNVVNIIFSNGMGWDHVSVSRPDRTPTWEEMCEVKAFFFEDDEVVVQYHPRKAEYVNLHTHCLHMWRPHMGVGEIPTPPTMMIGLV